MPLPKITVTFKETANTAISRGERGIVALILKDDVHTGDEGVKIYQPTSRIDTDFLPANVKQIQFALKGGINPPFKVLVYTLPSAAADYSEAQTYLEGTVWNYLAVPGINATDAAAMADWIKGLRDSKNRKVKAVLPKTAADHEGIINFCTDNIVLTNEEQPYNAVDYCSRIAGILAGNPLTISATYQALPEVADVPHLTNDELDTAIDAGKLVLMNDGEKVKIARAVNSLTKNTATAAGKGQDFQKIKIIDIMDMIYSDIFKTTNDNYIGKIPNNYDNKCLLIMAIRSYFESLENQQLLDNGMSTVDVDLRAQKDYLENNGTDTSAMSDQQIKEANTRDKVFLASSIKIVDAVEDFTLEISL